MEKRKYHLGTVLAEWAAGLGATFLIGCCIATAANFVAPSAEVILITTRIGIIVMLALLAVAIAHITFLLITDRTHIEDHTTSDQE